MPATRGYTIPMRILQEFGREPRIVIKKNWPGLYPVDPAMLAKLTPTVLRELAKTHEIIISPKEQIMG